MGPFVLAQLTVAIAGVLDHLLWWYGWIVIFSVVASWVNADPFNVIVRFLRGVTEPAFYQVRRRLPFVVVSGIDLSPIVVGLGAEVVRRVMVGSLYELASRLMANAGRPIA